MRTHVWVSHFSYHLLFSNVTISCFRSVIIVLQNKYVHARENDNKRQGIWKRILFSLTVYFVIRNEELECRNCTVWNIYILYNIWYCIIFIILCNVVLIRKSVSSWHKATDALIINPFDFYDSTVPKKRKKKKKYITSIDTVSPSKRKFF